MDTPINLFFFFNDTATTEIYTLSLHDALPIYAARRAEDGLQRVRVALGLEDLGLALALRAEDVGLLVRSEEHTSELQSRQYLVCRLLLEKKKRQSFLSPPTYPHVGTRPPPDLH